MILFFLIVLCASSSLIIHTYVIYPAILFVLPKKKEDFNPVIQDVTVAMLIAAYNEEKVIEDKLNSVLNNIPARVKIDIYVGSDGSTDCTDEIIEALSKKHPNVHLLKFKGRSGKANIINNLSNDLTHEIFILTDANVIFSKNTIEELLLPFQNEDIGLVCSNIIKIPSKQSAVEKIEADYIQRENMIKLRESDLWKIVLGAEGGCYAIRRVLFKPIPENFFMDDFFMTLNVLEQQKSIVFREKSICYEDIPENMSEEFKRKIRISIGNFQNLIRFKKLLFKFNALAFAYWSHKVLRWLTPFFMILIFISLTYFSIYDLTIRCAFCLILGYTFLSLIIPNKKLFRVFNYTKHFIYMNIALFIGFIKFINGVQSSVWTPTARNN